MQDQYNPYQQPQQPQQPYGAVPPQQQPNQYQQPAPQVNVTVEQPVQMPVERQMYYVSDGDKTLRLIAFIFMLVSLVCSCWLILPLAWMIPMTVITWGIYKGKKANSTAFAICTLLFCSIIAGVLLLISTKNK